MTLLITLLLSLGTTFSTDFNSIERTNPQEQSINTGQNQSNDLFNEQSYMTSDVDAL